MTQNEQLLEKGTFSRLFLHLCVPTILIMLVMVLYNMADTFFIGQTGDPAKIAALSLCAPLFSILSGLGTLFGSGGCTFLSLAFGRKETDKIKSCTSFCCYASLFLGLLFSALLLAFPDTICKALGADTATLSYASAYLRIIGLGAPFLIFNNVFANLIRADGSAVQSMAANLLGTVANILLDALFILVFSWDVAGAALATVLGNLISDGYLLYYVIKRQKAFSLSPRLFTLKKEISLSVLSLGIPLACSTILMSVSNVIANRMMASYGSTALAAQGVAGKIGMLISMLAMGICMGMQPAISYNFGRGNLARMNRLLRNMAVFNVVLGSILAILGFLFRDALISFFIENETVLSYSRIMLLASLATGPFYGLYQLCQTFLLSTGKASYATFAALLDKGLCYLPILFVMRHFFGMYGIAFTPAVTLGFSLAAGAGLSFSWRRTISREIMKSDETPSMQAMI